MEFGIAFEYNGNEHYASVQTYQDEKEAFYVITAHDTNTFGAFPVTIFVQDGDLITLQADYKVAELPLLCLEALKLHLQESGTSLIGPIPSP